MKKIYMLFILMIGMSQMMSASDGKNAADKAYQENNYTSAIELYNNLLSAEGESAYVYYNLGNCYYKMDSIAKSILFYERAILLNPNDEDIHFNLEMARSKTIDKVTPKSEIFLKTWIRNLQSLFNERAWSKIAIFSFWIMLIGLAMYIFSKRMILKKVGFSFTILFFLVMITSNIFAKEQRNILVDRYSAIVVQPTVTVRSTPDNSGTELFVLHEGAKLFIEDNSMNSWKEISLADGNRGWIPASAIEII